MRTPDDSGPLTRFARAGQARATLQTWINGANIVALLGALRSKGWLDQLTEPRTFDELTAFSGLTPDRVSDLVEVLEAHAVITRIGGSADDPASAVTVRLTDEFAGLAAGDAFLGLTELLDHAELTARLLRATTGPGPLPASEADALVTAKAAGLVSTPTTQAVLAQRFHPELPELIDTVRTERWLDVGCGVAGSTLTLAELYRELHGVAIELVPAVAAEARSRAAAAGVADRLEIRTMDARDLDEKEAFGGAFWAQPFFPASDRAVTLERIFAALKPAGLLFMQEMEPVPDEAGRASYSLRRLLARSRGVPFGRAAEELTDEAVAAGFEPVRIARTDFGRIVIVRRPGPS